MVGKVGRRKIKTTIAQIWTGTADTTLRGAPINGRWGQGHLPLRWIVVVGGAAADAPMRPLWRRLGNREIRKNPIVTSVQVGEVSGLYPL